MAASPSTRPSAPAAVRVRTVRSAAELEELRDAWARLEGDVVDANLDYLLAVSRTAQDVVRPHVLVAERRGEPSALLVGRLESLRLPCDLGYWTIRTPTLKAIKIVYGGLLGDGDRETVDALLAELHGSLASREGDVVVFRELPVGSPLAEAVQEAAPALRQDRFATRSVHREIRLPTSLDDFLASLSKSTRDSVRRYRNKVDRELGDRLDVRVYDDLTHHDELVETLDAVAARSWQQGLGASFRDDAANRERTRLALSRGWLRACVVFVDGQPVAFWHGLTLNGRLISGIPGFDPAFSEYRIGTYALLRFVDSLCRDPAISVLDFGFGDAEYKRRFANAEWEEQPAMIFAPRTRPLVVNATRTTLVGSSRAARSALRRVGLAGKLRSAWRSRLAASPSGGRTARGESTTTLEMPE